MNRTLYVVEGPSDLSALLSIGLDGIGRPQALGQEPMILEFIHRNKFSRVVIVSDADGVGQRGAEKLQASLSIPSLIWTPPAKDLREAVKIGLTKIILEAMTNDLLWTVPK